MRCPKCQFENAGDMSFCVECGNKLEVICPSCGFGNLPTHKFCGKCGLDLSKPEETPPIDYTQPQSYTPKFLQEKILTSRSAMQGERKLVTVLFADVANYTSLSEKLDPEEVHQIMDGCFKILMDEIHKYEGTINQFTGDGVMSLFGAPVAHEDHAQRACYAALAIQRAVGEYGEKIQKGYGVEFKMRVGLNSGQVMVGSIGDDLRMDYTAVGDTTNLAARMETMVEPGSVLVTGSTQRLAREFFEFESQGELTVKGKDKPVEAYRLIGPSDIETRFEASATRGLTPFVGRKNTMAALMDAYETARSESGQVVALVGEAGVGKSRLLFEFVKSVQDKSITYLEGRCLHYGETLSYYPFIEIVKKYCGIDDTDREYLYRKKLKEKALGLDPGLEATLPFLEDLLSLKVEDEAFAKMQPEQRRWKTIDAVKTLLLSQSQRTPLILAIEDMHWIDRSSEELLDHLIEGIPGSKILLICIYRPEYRHRWGELSYYIRLGVRQLTPASSTRLVEAICGKAGSPKTSGSLSWARQGAIPFLSRSSHAIFSILVP
ncbi:adenylate/guanylate cyclase domain-containing protein [Thermodesulfobacteriota bacterium]